MNFGLLVTTNRTINVYYVLVIILLPMYAVRYCLYSVGNKITTNCRLWDILKEHISRVACFTSAGTGATIFVPVGDLTHWGQVTHICVSKLTIIGSDNGLSPGRRQAIIWTNAGILLIGPMGTNFSEILIEIRTFSLKRIRLKMSSAKCCSFRLGLTVLKHG